MPANLKELRGKIKNVKSTQQITKAMKLVSAAKFGRAQQSVLQSRPYYVGMSELVSRLCGQGQISDHPLVQENGSKEVLLVVISSQRGLCGGYNANVAKETLAQVKEVLSQGKKPTVVCFGRKAYQLLTSRLPRIGFEYAGTKQFMMDDVKNGSVSTTDLLGKLSLLNESVEKPSTETANTLGEFLRDGFNNGTYGEVKVVYSEFGSAISQTPTTLDVLPMNPELSSPEQQEGEYIFEPSIGALVSVALPRFLNTQVLQVLKDASASEFGARMTAMDNATRNAKDMEKRYQVAYQRARQAAITTELVEIISGAEAL